MPVVRCNGIDICYEIIGEGEPLVLIMGFASQLIAWDDELCELLAARGFAVVRFDNRDVGLSSKLDHLRAPPVNSLFVRSMFGMPVPTPYTLRDMAADTVGLLDALAIDSAHIVGASMGGMIAQLVAIEYPQRVRSLTSIMSHPGDSLSRVGRPSAMRALLRPSPRSRAEAVERYL
ncbi:MAG: alpha/beta hydrolase, partial [Myxococcota bacterium]